MMIAAGSQRSAEQDAADWVVRLGGDTSEEDWLAFQAWLNSSPANGRAFDAAQALALEIEANAPALADALDRGLPPPRPGRRARFAWAAGAIACVAAAAVALTGALRGSEPVVYAAPKGERRVVRLDDGSRIDLNAGARVTVRYGRGARQVELAGTEAAFDVAHDAARPFTVTVGNRDVSVLGTQFNIRNETGALEVSVRRGLVQVSPREGAPGDAVRLPAGRRLLLATASGEARVMQAANDDAFAWTAGRLIYRQSAIGDVVDDLNRYFPEPIAIEGRQAANLRFTGVISLDSEDAVIRRLCALLPLTASHSDHGVTLRAAGESR